MKKIFSILLMAMFIIGTHLGCSSFDSYKDNQDGYLSFHDKSTFQKFESYFTKIITHQEYNVIIAQLNNSSNETITFSLDEFAISDSNSNSIPIWGFYCYEKSLSVSDNLIKINTFLFPDFFYHCSEFKGISLNPDSFKIRTINLFGSSSRRNSESNWQEFVQKDHHSIEDKKDAFVKFLTNRENIYVFMPLCSIQERETVNQLIEVPKKTNLFFILYTSKPLTEDGNVLINLWENQYQLMSDDKKNFIDMDSFVPAPIT